MAIDYLHTDRRIIGSIPYNAGQRNTLDIETGAALIETAIRLRFTITTTTTPMADPKWNVLARLIRRFELVVQEQDNVIAMDGAGLLMRALLDYGTLPEGAGDAFVLTAAPTTTNYDITIPIAHFLPRSQFPLQCAIDLRGINSASYAIQWGTLTDMVGTVGGGVLSNVQCDIVGTYLNRLVTQGNQRLMVRALDQQTKELTATNENFNIQMDKNTGLAYRSLSLVTTAADVAVDTILPSQARLVSGSKTFVNMPAAFIKNLAKSYRSLNAELVGIYPLDLPSLGDPNQMIATDALDADLRWELQATKVTGTNQIINYREAKRPLQIAA